MFGGTKKKALAWEVDVKLLNRNRHKSCPSVFGGTKKKALALDVKSMNEDVKSLKLQISANDKKGRQIMKAKNSLTAV